MPDGSRVTFEEYATANLSRLLGMAIAICGQPALAEDMLQEVLIKVHRKWEHIAPDAYDAYVRRSLVNEVISWRRKWARQVPTAEPLSDRSHTADQSGAVVDRDDLQSAINNLPPRQRAVLALRYYADLSDEAIAHDLGCSPGTVRAHASRALATLRVQRLHDLTRTERETWA